MPTAMALQRRRPTFSPRSGTDSAVTISGPTSTAAKASASGMKAKPKMNGMFDAQPEKARANCRPGLRVRRIDGGRREKTRIEMKMAWKKKRPQVIWNGW